MPSNALVPASQANRPIAFPITPTTLASRGNNVAIIVNVFDNDDVNQILNTLPNLVRSSTGRANLSVAVNTNRPYLVPAHPLRSSATQEASTSGSRSTSLKSTTAHWADNRKRYADPSAPIAVKKRRNFEVIEVVDDADPVSEGSYKQEDPEPDGSLRRRFAPDIEDAMMAMPGFSQSPRVVVKRSESEAATRKTLSVTSDKMVRHPMFTVTR
ncbi:hypothetical protein BD413DRAFT_616728 [Trametes elegans]|nr:hypothetical protein BD413DRAFT_616728 [Trametes elegans]